LRYGKSKHYRAPERQTSRVTLCTSRGRPRRHIGDLSREARRYASLAVTTLVKICRNGMERNRLVAARELLDRGYGRPIQMVDASILMKKLSELSPEELAGLEARLLTAATADGEPSRSPGRCDLHPDRNCQAQRRRSASLAR
jgi:hypothetical protein